MSELNVKNERTDLRRGLMVTTSVLALTGFIGMRDAKADEDTDRPVVWIELGMQVEQNDAAQALFAPLFFSHAQPDDLKAMIGAQARPKYSIGGESKITFMPENTNWVFSVASLYGRSNSATHLHHETPGLPPEYFTFGGNPFLHYTPAARVFGDGQGTSDSTHWIADFRAGKDFGLGMFGRGGSSVISAGVRFAQFTAKNDLTLHARPREHVTHKYSPGAYSVSTIARHTYTATLHAERETHAIGPSLSWDAAAPIAGSDNGMAVLFDWGVSGAILFGRQRVSAQHQTSGRYIKGLASGNLVSHYPTTLQPPIRANRAHTVTIPNLGGFAGLTFKYADAKLALGYRADFFFNAMDEGIDTRKSSTVGFHGPFATISFGVGG